MIEWLETQPKTKNVFGSDGHNDNHMFVVFSLQLFDYSIAQANIWH